MKTCVVCGASVSGNRKSCGPECAKVRRDQTCRDAHKRQREARGPIYVVRVTAKVCSRCRAEKPAGEYQKNRAMADGLQQICKACRAEDAQGAKQKAQDAARKAAWYARHAEDQAARLRARYVADRWQRNADSRAAYARKRDERVAAGKARYEANKERVRRVCICGRGYFVTPESRRYFCSIGCRRDTRWSVAAWLVAVLRRAGHGMAA